MPSEDIPLSLSTRLPPFLLLLLLRAMPLVSFLLFSLL